MVDFWAPWCQPCRLLGPDPGKAGGRLCRPVSAGEGRCRQATNIAAGFGVQSIPAVYAMRDGQLLDFFVGLKSDGTTSRLDRPSVAQRGRAAGFRSTSTNGQPIPAAPRRNTSKPAGLDANLASRQDRAGHALAGTRLAGRSPRDPRRVGESRISGSQRPRSSKPQLHLQRASDSPVDLAGNCGPRPAIPKTWPRP